MKQRMKKLLALLLTAAMAFPASGMTVMAAQPQAEPARAEIVSDSVSDTDAPSSAEADEKVSADEDSARKLTLMIYLVGSDLESNNYLGTMDMVEMIGGLAAAKAATGAEDLPIDVVVETGGAAIEENSRIMTRGMMDPFGGTSQSEGIRSIYNKYAKDANQSAGKDIFNVIEDGAMICDGSPYDIFKELSSDTKEAAVTGSAIDWTKNQRWELPEDLPVINSNAQEYLKPAKNQVTDPQRSMSGVNDGYVPELFEFITTTVENYPAENYALILWDHGGGQTGGYGIDDRFGRNTIPVDNIEKTLAAAKNHLESESKWKEFCFAGYDACLMSNYESGMTWKDYTDYLFVSEDLEGGQGWYYTPWLSELSTDLVKEDLSTQEKIRDEITKIGKTHVDTYVKWYEDLKDTTGTQAVLDLTDDAHVKDLDAALKDLSDAVVNAMIKQPVEAYKMLYFARADATDMYYHYSGMVDIRSFCNNLKNHTSELKDKSDSDAIINAADALLSLIQDGVGIMNYHKNITRYEKIGSKDELGGFTIFFPYLNADEWAPEDGSNKPNYLSIYKDAAIYTIPESYREMVSAYLTILLAGKDGLKEIYQKELTADSAELTALQEDLSKKTQGYYGIANEGLLNQVDSIIKTLQPSAMDRSDTRLINEPGETPGANKYYVENKHWDLVDNIYQHGQLEGENATFGLGYLPMQELDEASGKVLLNKGDDKDWFFIGGSTGKKDAAYPLNVYETSATDWEKLKNEDVDISVPLVLSITDENNRNKESSVICTVHFPKGEKLGTPIGFYDIDLENMDSPSSRSYTADYFDQYSAVPVYNFAEYMAAKANDTYVPEVDAIPMANLKFIRGDAGDVEENTGVNQETMLDNLKYAMYSESIELIEPYVLRDIFTAEYELLDKNEQTLTFSVEALVSSRMDTDTLKPDQFRLRIGYPASETYKEPEYYSITLPESQAASATSVSYDAPFLYYSNVPSGEKVGSLTAEGLSLNDLQSVYIGVEDPNEAPFNDIVKNLLGEKYEFYKNSYSFVSGGEEKVRIVKTKVDKDDVHSGMDKVMSWDYGKTITLVKGQKITFEKGSWKSSDPKKVSINKKSGKAKAKKATEAGTTVTLTNKGQTIEVIVVEPYFNTDKNGGWMPAGGITVITGSELSLGAEFFSGAADPAWVSSDPKVASVDREFGVVSANSPGKAVISAYVNGKAWSYKVNVTDICGPDVIDPNTRESLMPSTFGTNDITLNDDVTMNPGQSVTLKYKKDSNFDPAKATWSYKNNDNSIAVVEGNKLIAKKEGSILIKGKYTDSKDNQYIYTLDVTVITAPAKANTWLNEGDSETLKHPGAAGNSAWTASDANVVSVDNGKITASALKDGFNYCEVSCVSGENEYHTWVYVEKPELVPDEQLTAGKVSKNGPTYNLNLATGTRYLIPSGTWIAQTLNWKSSKSNVAFVDEYGVIEARKKGKAKVTTTVNGKTITINVSVK